MKEKGSEGLEVLQEALPTGAPTVSTPDVPPVAKPVASDMVSKNWAPLRNGIDEI